MRHGSEPALVRGRELAEQAARGEAFDALLIDARGDLERDVRDLVALKRGCWLAPAKRAASRGYLVLPAPAQRASLETALGRVAELELAGSIVTKLDECGAPAPALEFAAEHGLPIAFLSDGCDPERFHRATRGRFADLLLSGKVVA